MAVVIVYGNSLVLPLVFDDRVTILENPSIREWWNVGRVLTPDRELPVAGRPLANLTFALNYAAGGTAVEGYHIVNVTLHLACALLLFVIIRRTLRAPAFRSAAEHADTIAFLSALLWAVHPLNSEVVNYLSQRTESLMALATLTTLYASIRAQGSPNQRWWEAIAFGACLAGMASKETMVVAPLLVVLYDATIGSIPALTRVPSPADEPRGAFVRRRWQFYASLMGTWALLAMLQAGRPRGYSAGFSAGVDSWTYLLNQASILVQYARLLLWPSSLVANYGAPVPLTLPEVLPQALLVVLALLATVAALVRWRVAGFIGAWTFLTLAPTSSLIPIATEVGAERRMYLASMALVAGAVGLAALVSRRRPAGATWPLATMCGLVAVGLTAGTIQRNREYRSGLTLAETSASRWPSPTATLMLGTELAAAGRREEALPYLRAAAERLPRARYNLGVELFNSGDLDGARRELQAFVAQQPDLLEVLPARTLIGRTLAAQERWDEATAEFDSVLRMAPGNASVTALLVSALGNQGAALATAGRLPDAQSVFQRAVQLAPDDPAAHRNLATALYESRDATAALPHAQRAVQLAPGDAAAHNLLGRIQAVRGDLTEAERHLTQAVQLAPADRQARDDLARFKAAARP